MAGPAGTICLMQIQADLLGIPVLRSLSPDVSASGAAYLAGLATGIWATQDEIAALPRPCDRFEPRISSDERARAGRRVAERRPSRLLRRMSCTTI